MPIKAIQPTRKKRVLSYITVLFLMLSVPVLNYVWAECPQPIPPYPEISAADTYKGLPYGPKEKSTYILYWTKLKAGSLILETLPPVKHNNRWQQVYGFNAYTGDWFENIYIGRYQGKAFVRPLDHAVSKFRLSTYRDPPFEEAHHEDKWLTFDQDKCTVGEIIRVGKKPITKETLTLEHGAHDALGVFFRLRTFDYRIGKTERFLVYSSKKSWWLEAVPQAIETVSVPFGKHLAFKIKLLTYIGQDLQQKGDVYAWVSKDLPSKPLLKIEAEVKVGSVKIILEKLETNRL